MLLQSPTGTVGRDETTEVASAFPMTWAQAAEEPQS